MAHHMSLPLFPLFDWDQSNKQISDSKHSNRKTWVNGCILIGDPVCIFEVDGLAHRSRVIL